MLDPRVIYWPAVPVRGSTRTRIADPRADRTVTRLCGSVVSDTLISETGGLDAPVGDAFTVKMKKTRHFLLHRKPDSSPRVEFLLATGVRKERAISSMPFFIGREYRVNRVDCTIAFYDR